MSVGSRGVVYSLLTVVVVLLLGITALLWVAYHRHQRLEDATIDLQRNVSQQKSQIRELQERLEDCDTIDTTPPADTSWNSIPAVDSASVISRYTPAKR
ncbi:hypothetical protein ACFSUS_10715 [Spirosoma soli]|uniref:LapA family protein n=1 Tax=Spirosoma soli TaxID=1770529 RepID=A0ABW5M4J0_9BACT